MRGSLPASHIMVIRPDANSAVSGVAWRELIYRIAECRGVSPSMRLIGSHSKPSWSRRMSIISSIK